SGEYMTCSPGRHEREWEGTHDDGLEASQRYRRPAAQADDRRNRRASGAVALHVPREERVDGRHAVPDDGPRLLRGGPRGRLARSPTGDGGGRATGVAGHER